MLDMDLDETIFYFVESAVNICTSLLFMVNVIGGITRFVCNVAFQHHHLPQFPSTFKCFFTVLPRRFLTREMAT